MFCQTIAYPQLISGDGILGKWINEEHTRVLEFHKNGNYYEAIIKEAEDKSLIGKIQIANLQFIKDAYINGKLYLPKKGKNFPCTAKIKPDGTLEISAKASFMSKSQIWSKVK
jgi:uncharacterized protein (DUF2147 family)